MNPQDEPPDSSVPPPQHLSTHNTSNKHPQHSQLPQTSFPRTSSASNSTSTRPSDDLHALDAAAALANISPDLKMDPPEPSGHGRRRSSLVKSLDTSTRSQQGRRSPQSATSGRSIPEDSKTGDGIGDEDERGTSEEVELDDLSEDGLQDDEETGLTGQDKHRRRKRRRKNTLLDQRVAAEIKITAEEKKEADQNVLRNSLLNALLIGLWYLFSLSISIYNKWMFDPKHLDFHFPLFTTCMHMLVQFCLASLVLFFLPQFRPRHDSISNPHKTHAQNDTDTRQQEEDSKKPLMTRWFYFSRIGPCGVATGLDIGLGNMSLKFITLTFYTMCKSSSLAFVLIFAFLFRLESPSWRLVAIIATMTVGVIMMVAGEIAFSTEGFILVIFAAFFSGFRWALTQILLLRNPATSNPFSSIFYLAPIMFASLFLIAIPVEGVPAVLEGLQLLFNAKGPFLGPLIILFPGAIAFCMTAAEFALLKRTSVVTLSIAGIFKEVVTISAAGAVFGDLLTKINISGLVVTISAIAAYNYIKIRKMRADAVQAVHIQHVTRDGGGNDAEDDGSLEGSDWNTVDRSYVTSDGDILPSPRFFAGREVGDGTPDGVTGVVDGFAGVSGVSGSGHGKSLAVPEG